MQSIIEEFKQLSKKFSKPKGQTKKRRKKRDLPVVPTIVKKNSNISEDSDDPKRRKNVFTTVDPQALSQLNFKSPFSQLGQSINEEPFHSEEHSNESEDDEVKRDKKNEESKTELPPKKTQTNFFVHRKVKNTRQSILADRPLTIFKANTRKDSVFRFFSPPPQKSKLESIGSDPKIVSVRNKPDQNSAFKVKKKANKDGSSYRKVMLKNRTVNKLASKQRKFRIENKIKIGL
jgi:hypothetical protein